MGSAFWTRVGGFTLAVLVALVVLSVASDGVAWWRRRRDDDDDPPTPRSSA